MGLLGNIFKKKLNEKQDDKIIHESQIKSDNEILSDTNITTITSQTHLSSIINDAITELEKAGYGSIELDKFKQKVKDYTKADEINLEKGIMLRKIQHDKKILIEKITRAKVTLEGEALEKYTAEAEQYFKDTHGHPIDVEQRKKEALEELKKAGYGEEELEKFEKEFSKESNGGNAKEMIEKIELAKKIQLKEIETKKKILNASITKIQNSEVSETIRLFQELYDNDYRQIGSDYITALKGNYIDLKKIKFKLETGHDEISEYGNCIIQRLKLTGLGNEVCQEIQEQFSRISLNTSKSDLISKMNAIAKPYIARNTQNIVTYMQAKGLIHDAMSVLDVSGTENDFIKMLLSLSNTELKKCYADIDEKIAKRRDEIQEPDIFDDSYFESETSINLTFEQRLHIVETNIAYNNMVKSMETDMKTLVKESLQQNITRTEFNNTEAVRNEFKTQRLDKEGRDINE